MGCVTSAHAWEETRPRKYQDQTLRAKHFARRGSSERNMTLSEQPAEVKPTRVEYPSERRQRERAERKKLNGETPIVHPSAPSRTAIRNDESIEVSDGVAVARNCCVFFYFGVPKSAHRTVEEENIEVSVGLVASKKRKSLEISTMASRKSRMRDVDSVKSDTTIGNTASCQTLEKETTQAPQMSLTEAMLKRLETSDFPVNHARSKTSCGMTSQRDSLGDKEPLTMSPPKARQHTVTIMSHTEVFFRNLFAYLEAKKSFDACFEGILQNDPDATRDLLACESFNLVDQYPQRRADGKPAQSARDLAEIGMLAMGPFAEKLKQVCKASGFQPEDKLIMDPSMQRLQVAQLKSESRTDEKVMDDYHGDYSKVNDMVRGSILCKDVDQLKTTWDNLQKISGIKVVRLKNRFRDALFTGYRDMLILISIDVIDPRGNTRGHVCEMQLHLEEILTRKEESHDVYEYFRTYFRGDIGSMVDRLKLLNEVSEYNADNLDDLVKSANNWTNLTRLQGLVVLLDKMAVFDKAEQIAVRQLKVAEDQLGIFHAETVVSLTNLGKVLKTQHKLKEAEPLLERTLEANERMHGPTHATTLNSVTDMARLFRDQNKLDKAVPLFERALKGKIKIYGADHRSSMTAMKDLAEIMRLQNRFDEAGHLLRKAAAGLTETVGGSHEETLHATHTLALVYKEQNRIGEAEKLYRTVLLGKEKCLGADHPDTLSSCNNLAILLQGEERYDEAEPLCRRAVQGFLQALGPAHPATLSSMNAFASLLHRAQKHAEAESFFRDAYYAAERLLGATHYGTIACGRNLAEVLHKSGDQKKLVESISLLRRVLSERRTAYGHGAPEVAEAMITLAVVLKTMDPTKNLEESERFLRKAVGIYENHDTTKMPEGSSKLIRNSMRARLELADNLRDQKKNPEAEKVLQSNCNEMGKVFGIEALETCRGYYLLGAVQFAQNKFADAWVNVNHALKGLNKLLGPDNAEVLQCLRVQRRVAMANSVNWLG
eukprot:GEMP01005819.1.p1 GENE.GEMP01005819.1~~GEMP01005819.1.p1  ORF type:complete len:1000 (+),score=174.66 GEMP01005819.1:23-3022(+)